MPAGSRLISQIGELLEQLAPYGDEKDQLATALYGDSAMLKIDNDGRIVLPNEMRLHAGLGDQVAFVGLGSKFQMWEPAKFEAHRISSREGSRAAQATRRGAPPAGRRCRWRTE